MKTEAQVFKMISKVVYGRTWDENEPKRKDEACPPDDEIFSIYDICPSCHSGKMEYVKYDHGEVYRCEKCGAREKR